jgi:uncharacterized protein
MISLLLTELMHSTGEVDTLLPSIYLKAYPYPKKSDSFLLHSTFRASTVIVSRATWEAARQGALTGPEAETLLRLGMLVPDPVHEREQIKEYLSRSDSKSGIFKATVVLNLDCNLDCSYCYEKKFRHEQYMSQETAQLLVETLLRERIDKGLSIILTFYGGEPLLSEDLIRSISAPLQEAAEKKNLHYRFNVITNGTLFNAGSVQRLKPLGLLGAKFTLDGPREIHDRQRPYLSGAGSYDTILDNLAEVHELVPVQLGANFHREEYREFPRLLDDLVARGIDPKKLALVQFTPVTPKAGCAEQGHGCACSSEPWLAEALPFLREEALRRGFPTNKPTVSACMVEFEKIQVVNYDGTLYKCPAFMGWEGLSIGSLVDGVSPYGDSHRIGNWKNENCLDCAYLPLCFGGCRFLTLLQGKPMSELDCRREFFDKTLERYILQNIEYAQVSTQPAKAGVQK